MDSLQIVLISALQRIRHTQKGFTLAELLIALAILGVIATFTIPKILTSSTNGQNTAVAKEVASMISGSFSAYTLNNALSSGTTAGDLTQYMNYVTVDTSSSTYNFGTNCSSALCLKLHSGGVLQMVSGNSFGGTATTNALYFNVDPDGSGTATPATFVLYYNGRLTTMGQAAAGTTTSGTPATTVSADPSYIATW